MKRLWVYIIVGLLFFAAFSGTSLAVENRISSSTIPPSVRREGLIRSPNPIDRSSNLPVTGNIRDGRYFRGVVPYRAPNYFGETLPSSSLDSFLRDSAGPEDFSRSTAGYKPYYSPSRTVTTTMPGYSGVITPPTMNIDGRAAQAGVVGALPPRRAVMLDPGAAVSLRRSRPMSMTPEELEKLISYKTPTDSQQVRLTDQQYQAKIEQLKRDIRRLGDKTAELKTSLTSRDDYLLPSTVMESAGDIPQRFEKPTQKEQAEGESPETSFIESWDPDKQLDVYEQMKRQFDDSQKGREPAIQQAEDTAGSPLVRLGTPDGGVYRTAAGQGGKEPGEEQARESSQAKLAETDLSLVRAKDISGLLETFASFSEDKFNQHMRAAELHLKQGKYYRAADAYTLASLYKPDDPLAYAGKGHALFAAGEYMSSALFLSRALQIFPGYAQFKIDIEAMVGDRDKLETRVVDVEEWLQRSSAPELHFLLAYVYYQMDRPQRAKEAIDAAYEMMPEAPAVLALKKAIEDSI